LNKWQRKIYFGNQDKSTNTLNLPEHLYVYKSNDNPGIYNTKSEEFERAVRYVYGNFRVEDLTATNVSYPAEIQYISEQQTNSNLYDNKSSIFNSLESIW